jgi:hypothetical protein
MKKGIQVTVNGFSEEFLETPRTNGINFTWELYFNGRRIFFGYARTHEEMVDSCREATQYFIKAALEKFEPAPHMLRLFSKYEVHPGQLLSV